MANNINIGNNSWCAPATDSVWTPNIYAIMKDVWVLAYRDQLRLDEYFIMQTTKAKLMAELDADVMCMNYKGISYDVIIKGECWEISSPSSRWLLSFRWNSQHNFATVLAKPVNEAYGCPDYKHFPVGA